MGVFDSIQNRMYCPYCGHRFEDELQTKDFGCMMRRLKLKKPVRVHGAGEQARLYHSCKKCKSWVELVISKSDVHIPPKRLDKFSKRTEKAWKEYEAGKLTSKPKGKFLKGLKKW